MSRICGYSCEHNKSGICQISVCDKKSNISDKTEVQTFTRYIDPTITELQQENEQLKIQISAREEEYRKLENNWTKLRKWLEKELGDRINPNKDKWLTGVYDAYRETIDKMQELEQGSDKDGSDKDI